MRRSRRIPGHTWMNQNLEGIGRVEFLSVAVVIVTDAAADVVSGRNVSVVGGGTSVVVLVG